MALPSKPLTQLLGSNGPVHALTYSSSPSVYILTGSSDRSIRLYNPSRASSTSSSNLIAGAAPKPAQLIQTYSAHGYEVLAVSVAADNATFASCGGDRAVFLWDVATAKTLRRFAGNNGHTSRINDVCFAGAGDSVLISGSLDTTVRIWDVKSNSQKPIMILNEARDSISCVLSGSQAGKGGEYEIMAGSVDGRVRYYDLRMGQMDMDVVGTSVTSLQRTRDGAGVLVGGLDSCVRLLDRTNGGLLRTYKAEGWKNDEYRLRSCFGGSEKWVICGNEATKGVDGEVLVWDTLSGEVKDRVQVPGSMQGGKKRIGSDGKEKEKRNVISCVAWKENGRGDQWCCAGTDGVVTVFGLEA